MVGVSGVCNPSPRLIHKATYRHYRHRDGEIQGISAGAGLTKLSSDALYGLDDYRLITASGAAMTAALKRAIDKRDRIVVTAWSPHWMWKRFELRYLKDPSGMLGSREHVDAIASRKLADSKPEVHAMLTRMHYTLEQINRMLANAQRSSTEQAAQMFIDEHALLIAEWIGKSGSQ